MSAVLENSPSVWLADFPRTQPQQHKYDRGHAVILGGPLGSTGAAVLAAEAAARVGAGLVTVGCTKDVLPVYASHFKAVMAKPIARHQDLSGLLVAHRAGAALLGPGAGVSPFTQSCVLAVLETKKPVVLDADALTVFAPQPSQLFSAIDSPCIITPHAGEFARLFGAQVQPDEAWRIAAARAAAMQTNAVVILKGHHTIIASPDDRQVINRNATPYLATAGSGDVLSGLCVGLLAQGMSAFAAACAAVWLHGAAGNRIGAGLIADDLPNQIPSVLQQLALPPL